MSIQNSELQNADTTSLRAARDSAFCILRSALAARARVHAGEHSGLGELSRRTAAAAEYYGQVIFGRVPVPGATVTATQGDMRLTTSTDAQGIFRLTDIADGPWSIRIEMRGFADLTREVTIGPDAQPVMWELSLLPFEEIAKSLPPPPAPRPARDSSIQHQPGDGHTLAVQRADRRAADRLSTCGRDGTAGASLATGRGATARRSSCRCGRGRRRVPDQWQREQRCGVAVCAAGGVR